MKLSPLDLFDFHHHNAHKTGGIYNLRYGEPWPPSYFSAGIHPHDIPADTAPHFQWLKEAVLHPRCVAIGECGLDGLIATDEKIQAEIFMKQIEIANEASKPLIIHCVKRHSALLHFKKAAKVPMVVHGFNNRRTIGDEMLKHNFYLSFGKSVLHHVNLQQFVKEFPADRLFLETDSADFNLAELYEMVSSLKGISIETLSGIITNNVQTLLKLTD